MQMSTTKIYQQHTQRVKKSSSRCAIPTNPELGFRIRAKKIKVLSSVCHEDVSPRFLAVGVHCPKLSKERKPYTVLTARQIAGKMISMRGHYLQQHLARCEHVGTIGSLSILHVQASSQVVRECVAKGSEAYLDATRLNLA